MAVKPKINFVGGNQKNKDAERVKVNEIYFDSNFLEQNKKRKPNTNKLTNGNELKYLNQNDSNPIVNSDQSIGFLSKKEYQRNKEDSFLKDEDKQIIFYKGDQYSPLYQNSKKKGTFTTKSKDNNNSDNKFTISNSLISGNLESPLLLGSSSFDQMNDHIILKNTNNSMNPNPKSFKKNLEISKNMKINQRKEELEFSDIEEIQLGENHFVRSNVSESKKNINNRMGSPKRKSSDCIKVN